MHACHAMLAPIAQSVSRAVHPPLAYALQEADDEGLAEPVTASGGRGP